MASGDKLQEKTLRTLAFRRLGINPHTRRATVADERAFLDLKNMQDLPPYDVTAPELQLDNGRPVFVLGIDDCESSSWVL